MVEYCRYLLDAVACSLANLAIYVSSTDSVVQLSVLSAQFIIDCVHLIVMLDD